MVLLPLALWGAAPPHGDAPQHITARRRESVPWSVGSGRPGRYGVPPCSTRLLGTRQCLPWAEPARSVESMPPTTIASVADFGQILPAHLYGGLRAGN
ncbi:hypothetical protein QFZ49_008014 [Streptomyces turgidiscabies]|uniref:Uncharacterized protein n=1 Tax=Streptomyces turgidiscabies TaxID=85558 RepID=A0ABU0S1B8_9ACTN|nr:hypothetical protein [Streptomyces turgidiscabies]